MRLNGDSAFWAFMRHLLLLINSEISPRPFFLVISDMKQDCDLEENWVARNKL